MAQLKTKVELYLIANSKTWKVEQDNILLQSDNGEAPYIRTWNVSGLVQPTSTQLASYETAGNAVEANAGIDATRRTEYLSWDKQMEMIYKDQKNGTTTFKDHCDKVRSDNPKG